MGAHSRRRLVSGWAGRRAVTLHHAVHDGARQLGMVTAELPAMPAGHPDAPLAAPQGHQVLT